MCGLRIAVDVGCGREPLSRASKIRNLLIWHRPDLPGLHAGFYLRPTGKSET